MAQPNDMEDGERERERATYRRALEEIERMPPASSDPYPHLVVRFGQLQEYVRYFLQRLTTKDVDTLETVIRQHQGVARLFHFSRRTLLWIVGAILAGAIAGENVLKFVERLHPYLARFGFALW